jgi:hypothetical protein
MGKFVKLINGVMRMSEATELAGFLYDESSSVISDIPANTSITLPSSKTFDSKELEVYLNGQLMTVTEDYTYVGSPPRTQIQFLFDLKAGEKVRFRIDSDVANLSGIYDQVYSVISDIVTGTAVTLPASGTYSDIDLQVYLNGQLMESLIDYNFVGAVAPRNQVAFTFDLEAGDLIRFRKEPTN